MSERKDMFIRELAVQLAGNQVEMSMRLQTEDKDAKRWAVLRGMTPLFGYPTVAEAEATLRTFLCK